MADETAPLHCRFVRRMVSILSEVPEAGVGDPDDSLFQRLVRLEQDAKAGGASESSLHVIGYVRETTWSFVVVSAMGLRHSA